MTAQSIVQTARKKRIRRACCAEEMLLVNGRPMRCRAAVHSPDVLTAMGRVRSNSCNQPNAPNIILIKQNNIRFILSESIRFSLSPLFKIHVDSFYYHCQYTYTHTHNSGYTNQ